MAQALGMNMRECTHPSGIICWWLTEFHAVTSDTVALCAQQIFLAPWATHPHGGGVGGGDVLGLAQMYISLWLG